MCINTSFYEVSTPHFVGVDTYHLLRKFYERYQEYKTLPENKENMECIVISTRELELLDLERLMMLINNIRGGIFTDIKKAFIFEDENRFGNDIMQNKKSYKDAIEESMLEYSIITQFVHGIIEDKKKMSKSTGCFKIAHYPKDKEITLSVILELPLLGIGLQQEGDEYELRINIVGK